MKRRSFLRAGTLGAGAAAASSLAAPLYAQGKRELTMVTSVPHGFAIFDESAVLFIKMIEEMTEGQITFDKRAAGELVGAFEVFDAVSSGQADCYHSGEYFFMNQHPAYCFFTNVPFGATRTEMDTWYFNEGGRELHDELGQIFGLKTFLVGTTGAQSGGWFRNEIKSADDLKGLKFRMPGIGGQALGLTGASVQTIPGGEIYQALSSGALDGTEWIGPYGDERLGFYEVCKYYYPIGFHEPGAYMSSAFNLDIWESLTPGQQMIIDAASQATTTQINGDVIAKNSAAMRRIQSQGVKLMEFSDDVWEAFGTASAQALDKYMDDDLYVQVRESFESSLKNSSEWLGRAEYAYVRQRDRVLRG